MLYRFLLGVLLVFMSLSTLMAHVGLNSPAGGESYIEGEVVNIEWVVLVAHGLENWDLEYSTVSESGPWVLIAEDITAGDPSTGAVHDFDWTIPAAAVSPTVWIRIMMDNTGIDYEDVNPMPFEVTANLPAENYIRGDTNQDQAVDLADAIRLLNDLFVSAVPNPCLLTADTNDDSSIDIADVIRLLGFLFAGEAALAAPFPSCGLDQTPDQLDCVNYPGCP